MNQIRITNVRRALIGAVALLMIQGCGNAQEPSRADDTADLNAVTPDVRIYETTAAKLIAQLGEPGSKSSLPGPNDPTFRQFSDQAAALTGALGTEQYPVSIQTFGAICAPATRVLLSYQLTGAAEVLSTAASEPAKQKELVRLSADNMTKHFDQLFPVLIFSAHCVAVHLPEAEKFAQSLSPAQLTDVRKGGVRQIRDGLFNSVSGLLMVASDPELDERRRIKVLRTLANDSKLMVASLSLDDRPKLTNALNSFRRALNGDSKTYGDVFAGELQSQKCNVICSM